MFIRFLLRNQITVRWVLCRGTSGVESRWLEGWNALMCIVETQIVPEEISSTAAVLCLTPRLRLCAAHDYQSHTTRWRPVRYIWLHMPTCIMAPKADDGILRGADDADPQQGDDNGWNRWTHVRTKRGFMGSYSSGFVDSRRIAAGSMIWENGESASSLRNPLTEALPHRMIVSHQISPFTSMTWVLYHSLQTFWILFSNWK